MPITVKHVIILTYGSEHVVSSTYSVTDVLQCSLIRYVKIPISKRPYEILIGYFCGTEGEKRVDRVK